jgi:hypothetical protein
MPAGTDAPNTPRFEAVGIGRHVSESIAAMLESKSVTLCELLEARTFLEAPLAAVTSGPAPSARCASTSST